VEDGKPGKEAMPSSRSIKMEAAFESSLIKALAAKT
jgi:hypothetical protein